MIQQQCTRAPLRSVLFSESIIGDVIQDQEKHLWNSFSSNFFRAPILIPFIWSSSLFFTIPPISKFSQTTHIFSLLHLIVPPSTTLFTCHNHVNSTSHKKETKPEGKKSQTIIKFCEEREGERARAKLSLQIERTWIRLGTYNSFINLPHYSCYVSGITSGAFPIHRGSSYHCCLFLLAIIIVMVVFS